MPRSDAIVKVRRRAVITECVNTVYNSSSTYERMAQLLAYKVDVSATEPIEFFSSKDSAKRA